MERSLVTNIGLLATPEGRRARGGASQGSIRFLKDAWILCENGRIAALGTGEPPVEEARRIDAAGCLVTPGLVDAHTHLIFGGWRQNELALKLRGVSYLEILAAGGGILSTLKATREASEDELFDKACDALDEMLELGVTTAEAKSGYGLDLETELKQLRVIRRLDEEHPMDLAATFLGAHALPPEYKEVVLGHAEIKAIYDIGKLGKIAGSQMLDGKLVAKERYRILRQKEQVWDGRVQTLRHFKDEVKEVTGQQECGVCFANYEEFRVGDVIECYLMEELPRSL